MPILLIQSILKHVYAFYHRSPKRYRGIEKIANKQKLKVTKFKRIDGTRWVAHRKNAMEALHDNYTLLLDHWKKWLAPTKKGVSDVDKAKMRNWIKKLSSYKFYRHMHLYLDVFTDISSVSHVFQEADISLPTVITAVEQALENMEECVDQGKDGPWLASAKKDLDIY